MVKTENEILWLLEGFSILLEELEEILSDVELREGLRNSPEIKRLLSRFSELSSNP